MRFREYFLVTYFRGKNLITQKMYSLITVMGLPANRVVAIMRCMEGY